MALMEHDPRALYAARPTELEKMHANKSGIYRS